MAITALITIKAAINARIKTIWLLWLRSFLIPPLIRSSVNVELELITSEESVLIDAETTKINTSAMRIAGRLCCSIVGMIVSYRRG